MIALFIWGFALYGLAMMIWQWILYGIRRQKPVVAVTAVLVVQEGASYMEGILRSLTTNQEFMRRTLKIVVIDCGSQDETGIIVEKFSQRVASVRLIRTDQPQTALIDVLLQDAAVSCVFDLRGPVAPSEVVPTLFAFCQERQA